MKVHLKQERTKSMVVVETENDVSETTAFIYLFGFYE